MVRQSELPDWKEQPIHRSHNRKDFDCGNTELNTYVARYARQNHELSVSKTFVMIPDTAPSVIMGYYSINACQINGDDIPNGVLKRVGKYPIPAVMLGRLAVDIKYQGIGLGGILLLSAGERVLSISEKIGIRAIVIDAKDELSACWYERFGAIRLKYKPLSLILSLDTISTAIAK